MQPSELTISTRHLQFSALEMGNPDGKVILALHGWLDNAASFIPLAEPLSKYRIIAVDLAGHGLSQHRPVGWSYDIWHYVEDLLDIVEALQLNNFALVGHSMGAVIATMAAATVLQDQISNMILIDGLAPSPRQPEEAPLTLAKYVRQRRIPAEELPVSRYRSMKQAIRARAISQYKVSRHSAELLVERSLRQDGEDWLWTADPRLKLGSPARFTLGETMAFINSVACPTDVIYAKDGEISDIIASQLHRVPHMTFHALVGTHHLHMDDQVEAVADIIDTALG